MTKLIIVHKSFPERQVIITSPSVIPRKGDKIDMGFDPAPEVTGVVWQFEGGLIGADNKYATINPNVIITAVCV